MLWLVHVVSILSQAASLGDGNFSTTPATLASTQQPAVQRASSTSNPIQQPKQQQQQQQLDGPPLNNFRGITPRCDFGGQRLKVAVRQQPPLVSCEQDATGQWLCNGSNVELVHVLESRLNFTADWLVVMSSTSGGTGDPAATLKMVQDGRVLMSANGFMRTRGRLALGDHGRGLTEVQLSEPFDAFQLHLLLSKSVHDHHHIFVKPFQLNAWLGILASALLMVPSFYLVNVSSAHHLTWHAPFLRSISWRDCLRFRLRSWMRTKMRSSPSTSDVIDRNHTYWNYKTGSTSPPDCWTVAELAKVSDEPLRLELDEFERSRSQKRVQKITRRLVRAHKRRRPKSGFFRLAYVLWYVVASLASQGGETEDLPEASSTRILIAFWWLYLIVIVSIHSGILTAILTFPKQRDFIKTLDDFLMVQASAHMPVSLDRHGELAHLLAPRAIGHHGTLLTSTDSHQTAGSLFGHTTNDASRDWNLGLDNSALRQVLQPESIHLIDFDRHRQRILDEVARGTSAHLEERSVIRSIITDEYLESDRRTCDFKASRHALESIPMSFALSSKQWLARPTGTGSAGCLLERANLLLSRVRRTGLAQKWRRKFEPSANDCLETVVINAGDVRKIELRHLELGFWLLASGFGLGTICLLAEIVWLFADELDEEHDEKEAEEERDRKSPVSINLKSISSSTSGFSSSQSSSSYSSSMSSRSQSSSDLESELDSSSPGAVTGSSLRLRRMFATRRSKRVKKVISKLAPLSASSHAARSARRVLEFVRRLHEGHLYSGPPKRGRPSTTHSNIRPVDGPEAAIASRLTRFKSGNSLRRRRDRKIAPIVKFNR